VNNDECNNYSEEDSASKVHPRNILLSHLLLGYHDLLSLLYVTSSEKVCVEVEEIVLQFQNHGVTVRVKYGAVLSFTSQNKLFVYQVVRSLEVMLLHPL